MYHCSLYIFLDIELDLAISVQYLVIIIHVEDIATIFLDYNNYYLCITITVLMVCKISY